ncbi:DNA topoisomerase [Lysinibacillus sphaericus]|uniref:DNA topoisomerase n=1 Tax=Lysinibacillus sphaericus TaxID=1421 RepID=UPI00226CEED8|nr:DNA topoisomerase [Lysinibacillus sphaericus]
MNASQLYSLLLQRKGLNTSLSVGRVQSPLVYMIYQQQKEIKNFVSKPFLNYFTILKQRTEHMQERQGLRPIL